MAGIDENRLAEVTRRVGKPRRWLSALWWRDGRSPPPAWLKPDDLISRIYANQGRILRDGVVRWAVVVHANQTVFEPGPSTSGAQVVYGPGGDVPLDRLRAIARRAFGLKGTTPSDPAERRLADMLTDEMERALDWPIPKSLTGGADVVTTIVMLPRDQMPGGFLGMTEFPILADPATSLAVLVPCRFWPDELRAEWQAATEKVLARLEAVPVVQLTPAAAQRAREAAAEQGLKDFWVRVGVKLAPEGGFQYVLDIDPRQPDPSRDLRDTSGPVPVVVDRNSRAYLLGTTLDYRAEGTAAGFLFNNPNAQRR